MLIGCMAGAVLGGPMAIAFGRKPSLIFCAILFAASSCGGSLAGYAIDVHLGSFCRWRCHWRGFHALPALHCRDRPEKIRGTLVALYQLAIVGGHPGGVFRQFANPAPR